VKKVVKLMFRMVVLLMCSFQLNAVYLFNDSLENKVDIEVEINKCVANFSGNVTYIYASDILHAARSGRSYEISAGGTPAQPRIYCLSDDVHITAELALNIQRINARSPIKPVIKIITSNIVLDLNGHAVTSEITRVLTERHLMGSNLAPTAVYANSSSNEVTIENGDISGFAFGVNIGSENENENTNNLNINNLNINDVSLKGIYAGSVDGIEIKDNTIIAPEGIYVVNVGAVSILDNDIFRTSHNFVNDIFASGIHIQASKNSSEKTKLLQGNTITLDLPRPIMSTYSTVDAKGITLVGVDHMEVDSNIIKNIHAGNSYGIKLLDTKQLKLTNNTILGDNSFIVLALPPVPVDHARALHIGATNLDFYIDNNTFLHGLEYGIYMEDSRALISGVINNNFECGVIKPMEYINSSTGLPQSFPAVGIYQIPHNICFSSYGVAVDKRSYK
jgi:hypothetical protein